MKIGLEKLINFIVQGSETFCIHLPLLLLHWFGLEKDEELVGYDGGIHPGHIG